MKGILDRIEDGKHAVILVEEINKQFVLPASKLPPGSEVHAWFNVTVEGEQITSITLDQQLTDEKKQNIESLANKIRSKNKGSKFKRK